MSNQMETYTNKDILMIIEDIKKLTDNSQITIEKLNELLKYPAQNRNLEKLENVLYMIKHLEMETFQTSKSTYKLKDSLIYDSIDILLEYEYFNLMIDNKSKYDEAKLKEKYEEISKFITNKQDIKLHFPQHPNHLYKNKLANFLLIYKLKKEDALNILNELLDSNENNQITKKYKQGLLRKINQYKNEINNTSSKEKIKILKKKIANLKKLFS